MAYIYALEDTMSDNEEGMYVLLGILFSGPLLAYDYYQNLNFSFFYVPFFPIALFWWMINPTDWYPSQLH